MASGPAIAQRWEADGLSLDSRDDVWELEAEYLAQLVRVFYFSFSPDVVLFGGGVGTRPTLPALVQTATIRSLAGYPSERAGTGLVAAAGLGEDAGLYGAAILAATVARLN
jgi:fructokinase